ncbi:MAG: TIGR02301 family protein [Hyphomicrobiaceae bacterium]
MCAVALRLALCLSLLVAGSLAAPVHAEDKRPYDDQLIRLAEILGAVHYLRELCGAGDGMKWRDRMEELIEAEGATAIRRARFIGSFNKGYRGYKRTYQTCTKSAETAIGHFLVEGAEIASAVADQKP